MVVKVFLSFAVGIVQLIRDEDNELPTRWQGNGGSATAVLWAVVFQHSWLAQEPQEDIRKPEKASYVEYRGHTCMLSLT